MTTTLPVASIRLDGGTQPRAYLDATVIEDYAVQIANGATFPPVVVFYDGSSYFLGDGFHRYHAQADALGLAEIECDVRQGTQRDAILFSCGANAEHGMRRTNEDKRRAVRRMLEFDDWRARSDREIARHCFVDDAMVSRLRAELYPEPSGRHGQIERMVTRGGTTYPMNVGGIAGANRAREGGHREQSVKNLGLAIETTLMAISRAMDALPTPETAAAARPGFDLERAERIGMWWNDFIEELRERTERAT